MSEFKIEKNVPFSITHTRHNYPFADMEVGDSFESSKDSAERLRVSAYQFDVKRGWKFSVKKNTQDATKCRVWRIS